MVNFRWPESKINKITIKKGITAKMENKWDGRVCYAATKGKPAEKGPHWGQKTAEIEMQKATKTKRLDNR